MHTTIANLIDALDQESSARDRVITWASPIVAFGEADRSLVATVGINPSNREFVDGNGNELAGADRRFHTLESLGLQNWSQADCRDIAAILATCTDYFRGNPYDRWFRTIDRVIVDTGSSFYSSLQPACHLDLVPYATEVKWTDLTSSQRAALLARGAATLAAIVRDSAIEVLVLNGRAVVEQFMALNSTEFERIEMPQWQLARATGTAVRGIGYVGVIESLNEQDLGREVLVLGYNHNLQSSFGVSSSVIRSIRAWIATEVQQRTRLQVDNLCALLQD